MEKKFCFLVLGQRSKKNIALVESRCLFCRERLDVEWKYPDYYWLKC